MRKLIEDTDLGFVHGKLSATFYRHRLKSVLGITQLNTLYSAVLAKGGRGKDFWGKFLDEISVEIIEENHENISALLSREEGNIVLCNCPHGGIDALVVMATCLKYKEKTKIVVPDIITEISAIKDQCIVLDTEGKHLKKSYEEIRDFACEGGNVVIFGTDGIYKGEKNGSVVGWKSSVLKLISRLNLPIIPLFIKGANSLSYQALRSINPRLALIASIREVVNKRGGFIKIIDCPRIEANLFTSFGSPENISQMMGIVFGLCLEREKELLAQRDNLSENEVKDNDDEIDFSLLKSRIRDKKRDMVQGNLELYILDNYEVVVLDTFKGRVVGYSQLALGKSITSGDEQSEFAFFKDFEYSHKLDAVLNECLEVQRTIIEKTYPSHAQVLGVIAEGQIEIFNRAKDVNYLLWSATISNSKSKLSRRLLTHQIKKNFYDNSLSKFITARSALREKTLPFITKSNSDLTNRRDVLTMLVRYADNDNDTLYGDLKKFLQNGAQIIALGKRDSGGVRTIKGLVLLEKQL